MYIVPGPEDFNEGLRDSKKLAVAINTAIERAEIENDNFEANHDHDAQEIHINLLPKGEEVIRLREALNESEESAGIFEDLRKGVYTSDEPICEAYEKAMELHDSAEKTFYECEPQLIKSCSFSVNISI